jgi:geranylgeranyl diphosphate synthase type II
MAFVVVRCGFCGGSSLLSTRHPSQVYKKENKLLKLSSPQRHLEKSKWLLFSRNRFFMPQRRQDERDSYSSMELGMVTQVAPTEKLLKYLQEKKDYVEKQLEHAIPLIDPRLGSIHEAMMYSLLAGGKRIRPILCLASCELFGGSIAAATPTALALEMIHTMSLIHDDLPAMDNDDYRRGKLTNHKVFGEDIAILAGDALLARAFEYIASETKGVATDLVLKVISILGSSVGYSGIVGGQVVDIQSEGKEDISVDDLIWIHKHKTGALLKCCVVTGALLGGANKEDVSRIGEYAERIGLAFQVADDILDVTSSFEELGKSIGKDEKSNKATFPRLMGLEESQKFASRLVEESKTLIEPFGSRAYYLRALADYIISRKY